MRKFILFFLLLSLFGYRCFAQNQVIVDKYPAAVIFVVDPQSGQEVQATDGNAVLFKDAFIDLVTNTPRARMTLRSPGHKSFVITQTDPANGNAFQLTQQSRIFGQDITNYTFSYNVDQNTLYYLDPNSQSWLAEVVQGYNVLNLNNCLAYGKFNEPNNNNPPQQAQDASQQPPVDAAADQNITTNDAPPPLQDDIQPDCPVDGYLWQPGYWAYGPGGYYWVAGTWVAPPTIGYLWTPPYWGFEGGVYIYHSGYWGTSVGFYGGVYYGYGYAGTGYVGGGWYGGHFRYNTAVVRVSPGIHNVYADRTVVHTTVINRVSYNGGAGGTHAMPTAQERTVMAQPHVYDHSQDPKAPVVNRNNNNQAGRNNNGNVNRPGAAGPGGNNNRPVTTNSQNGNRQGPQTLSTVNKPGAPAVPPGNRPPVPQGPPGNRPAANNNNRQGMPASKPANNKPVKQPKQNDTHDKK
jgi:hypothetical protein